MGKLIRIEDSDDEEVGKSVAVGFLTFPLAVRLEPCVGDGSEAHAEPMLISWWCSNGIRCGVCGR